jgi:mono/diheme cytochrome c family protein
MKHVIMSFVLLAAISSTYAAGTPETASEIRARGEQVAVQYCGACHATGKTGVSPNAKSPVFRSILAKQPAGAIAEDLREGLHIGHKTMPRVQLLPEDVDALMSYLISIQETES